MILFNKTWNNEVLSRSLLDIVQPSVDPNVYCGICSDNIYRDAAVTYVDGICTVSLQQFGAPTTNGTPNSYGGGATQNLQNLQNEFKSRIENFSLVTEKFIKVLDKFYKKLYHEDFTQNVFYNQHILSIFQGIASQIYINTISNHGGFTLYNKNIGLKL